MLLDNMDNKAFRDSLVEIAGEDIAGKVMSALADAPSVSVRVNPRKVKSVEELGLPVREQVPWSSHGYMLDSRPSFTLDPLFHAGAYYVQDSSAMFVGEVFRKALKLFDKERIVTVLDLCAAPGGKTTDIIASLREVCGGRFVLVANEVMKQRAGVLAENVARWGDPNVVVTSVDPKAFARLTGFFDIIVADVPCSGEGMFRKDAEAVDYWSEDTVALCESRQRRIVSDVWPALTGGGCFVYSTCTFNRRENDGNVQWMSQNLGAEVLDCGLDSDALYRTECGVSLFPGLVPGEGQYCALLRKSKGVDENFWRLSSVKSQLPKPMAIAISEFFEEEMTTLLKGTKVIALPDCLSLCYETLSSLRPIASGVAVGDMMAKGLIPDADLAMSYSLRSGVWPEVELNLEQSLAFLRKDPLFVPDCPQGYLLLKYRGCGLGFVKNIGSRWNSLLPNGRRIRMKM